MYNIEELIRPIGIIGGLGTKATGDIRERILAEAQKSLPHGFLPVITRDFSDAIMELDKDGTIPNVLKPSRGLLNTAADIGPICEFIVLTAHTFCLFQEDIENISGRPVLSMVDVTLEEITRRDVRSVGIVEYSTTLKHRLYQNRLDEMGVEYVTITDKLSQSIDKAIDSFVENKLPLVDLAFAAQVTCTNLLYRGADAIILACTELPLGLHLLKGIDRHVLINPNQLLAEAAVARAITHLQEANYPFLTPDVC